MMPIRKFHDISEMEDAVWYERTDPRRFAAIARTWSFAARSCALRFPPGVHKHRSIEAADSLRDRWEQANFDAFHARRRGFAGPKNDE